ncbi:galactokinase [Ligilactobacillus acidipiscis DSM 15836]|uniref:Galactokinase n=2 Tax=Ligilactobacillus acidipiscis TaxID=89059 RepID=A0ABR5PKJ1_9LACO|nr:galactokinase [Ligilactobacillus acidipiscis DSM 15836]
MKMLSVYLKIWEALSMDKQELITAFTNIYQSKPSAEYFSPGRINLIGEHTDYNGGHVFPCAISLGIWGAVAKRTDRKVRLYSGNFTDLGVVEADLDSLEYSKKDSWANYVKGMIKFLQEAGHVLSSGLDIYINGNIPNGSGLSSSAALEMLIGSIVNDQFNLGIERLDLIKLGVKTENEFIGVNSGIMDQFAVGMGQKDHALLLDTNTLEYEVAPIDLKDHVIIIMNTNKRRELADSKYNERRAECEKALSELQTELDISSLGELDANTFDEYSYLIEDGNRLKRARHAVLENERTLRAKKLLQEGKLAEFGRLVNASHVSLEHDYEVTGKELDTLVHTAWQQDGVLGARMTGAGFGGCAIAIVASAQVPEFEKQVAAKYTTEIGYAPSFYEAKISDGTKVI